MQTQKVEKAQMLNMFSEDKPSEAIQQLCVRHKVNIRLYNLYFYIGNLRVFKPGTHTTFEYK